MKELPGPDRGGGPLISHTQQVEVGALKEFLLGMVEGMFPVSLVLGVSAYGCGDVWAVMPPVARRASPLGELYFAGHTAAAAIPFHSSDLRPAGCCHAGNR